MPAQSAAGAAKRRSSWGPPRKMHNRTGANPAFAEAIATALPGVESRRGRGRTSFSVDGQRFLTVDDECAVVMVAGGDEHTLLFVSTGRDAMRAAIEDAWRGVAPKRQVTQQRNAQAKRAKEPAITVDDIRRIILSFPGAVEGPIWGKDPGFLIGTEKKTRFARFGPPEGSNVSNLLPPDDEDALVILRCRQRPEVLATSPDRFFTTPHYGPPDEPGAVITRLAENRGAAELQEIAELLEDAWREVASPQQIAELEARKPAQA